MNIMSIENAYRTHRGPDHWFWAVWISVEQTPDLTPEPEPNRPWRPYNTWNKTAPTDSGFCSSEKEARHAAWAAIRSLSNGRPNACGRGWGHDFLRTQRENDKRPVLSRCKVGKDNWLWVVYESSGSWFDDDAPIANGFATSPELAHEHAEAAVGPVVETYNGVANHFRKKQAAIKRSQRPRGNGSAEATEFVFCFSEDEYAYPHRIIKRTAQRIYIDRRSYRPDSPQQVDDIDTCILDRAEFEANGCMYVKSLRRYVYASREAYIAKWHVPESRGQQVSSPCLVALGVEADATREDIKAAYRRLAIKAHPDVGGDAEEFKRLQEHYELAVARR